jgi:hypothetical protein
MDGPGMSDCEIRAGTQRSIKASTCMLGIYDTDG